MTSAAVSSRLSHRAPHTLVCVVSGNLRNGRHLQRLVALNRARNPRHYPSPSHIHGQSSCHVLICDKQVANLQIQQVLRMDLCFLKRENYVDDGLVGIGCRLFLTRLAHFRIVGCLDNRLSQYRLQQTRGKAKIQRALKSFHPQLKPE